MAVLSLLSLFLPAVTGSARAGDPKPSESPKKDGPAAPAAAQTPDPVIVLREGLRLPAVGSKKPTAIHRDPVEARLVRGTWAAPQAGDTVVAADGETKTWSAVKANEKGAFEGDDYTAATYVSLPYESPDERVLLLHAVGHDFVYVNAEMRAGDPYGYGWLRLPVLVRKGANELLFRVTRGRLVVELEVPPAAVYLSPDDPTLPDAGGVPFKAAGIVVVNATATTVSAVRIAAVGTDSSVAFTLPPLSIRKVPVEVPVGGPAVDLVLTVGAAPEARTQTYVFPKSEGGASGAARTTFVSRIDGSVQYYASAGAYPDTMGTMEAEKPPPRHRPLVLSLHGASVEAIGQCRSYADLPGRVIVCPTNRRPYGFDWEDWGRLDALEVLDLANKRYEPDSDSIFLTGHSMGGHGTWQLGATYPDLFAAIGPSAGWISFSTYGRGPADTPGDAVDELLLRASNSSDTKTLATNLETLGVYVLHGDADDNVPVEQAREMTKLLNGFHRDWRLFEQKGAGHWWDVSKAPGADCVDWPPMFEFFARHRRACDEQVADVDFTTMDPAVSNRLHWATIDAQTKQLAPSRVRLHRDSGAGRIAGTTENCERVSLHVRGMAKSDAWTVVLDQTTITSETADAFARADGRLRLLRGADGTWTPQEPAFLSGDKRPARGGSFKTAYRNGFRLVYGTSGTPEENAASYARARLDAETWYYRGNGGAAVVSDRDVLDMPGDGDKNLILYGNADTNAAWKTVLAGCPVKVSRGKIVVGSTTLPGDDLGCLLVYPRAESTEALVGVVAGTGPAGLRVTERLPIFSSGVRYPDLTILGADVLERGNAGVRCAGFFGNDWSIERGEFAWHEGLSRPPAPGSPAPRPSSGR